MFSEASWNPLLWALLCAIRLCQSQCYFPGGDLAANDRPCDQFAFTSLCCPFGWTCFSSKICIITDSDTATEDLPIGTSIRGTCTNPDWNNNACGDFCLNEPVNENNGSLTACGDGRWCCQPEVADGLCDCDSGRGTFSIKNGRAQTIIGVEGLSFTSTGSLVTHAAPPSTSSSSPSSAVHSSQPAPATVTKTPSPMVSSVTITKSGSVYTLQSTIVQTASPPTSFVASIPIIPSPMPPATPSPMPPATPSESFAHKHRVVISVGTVCGALGLALGIIGILWCLGYRRKRREKQVFQSQHSPDPTMLFPAQSNRSNGGIPLTPIPHPYHVSDHGDLSTSSPNLARYNSVTDPDPDPHPYHPPPPPLGSTDALRDGPYQSAPTPPPSYRSNLDGRPRPINAAGQWRQNARSEVVPNARARIQRRPIPGSDY